MLKFFSASARVINSRHAIAECFQSAMGDRAAEADLVIIHASMGHSFEVLVDEARRLAPSARIVGASCCGVVGREGVSESMKDVAVMMVVGKDFAIGQIDGIYGSNSEEKCRGMAVEVKREKPNVNMVYLMAPGIDIANDGCIRGIESVFGPEVTIFGATSSDNMKGIVSWQSCDDSVYEHSAWMIGFADPTLSVRTSASHGFVAVGEPLVVTKAAGNRIIEFNDRPAWMEYTGRLGLPEDATCGDSIPIGALAEALSSADAASYGSSHILRVVTSKHADGGMDYPVTVEVGAELFLTVRDEKRIFEDLDRMVADLVLQCGDKEVVAVFHADCLARGRHLFNRILKEELVSRMQGPFMQEGEVPSWLGMYGFGEFARLNGRNAFHNYTTAIYVMVRSLD
jgi:hypothetical protein